MKEMDQLRSSVSGIFDKILTGSDERCHICNEVIEHYDPKKHKCRKCGDITCALHMRMQNISEDNRQLMCGSCAEMLELETIRYTCIQQVDNLKVKVKESEDINRKLIMEGETLHSQNLQLEKDIADTEHRMRLDAEKHEAELIAEEERKRKALEEVYALTQVFKELSESEDSLKQAVDALDRKQYCLQQETAHARAACTELSTQVEEQHTELKRRVPVFKLKSMLCKDCYQKVRTVYHETDEGRELFSSVVSIPRVERPPLEQFTCFVSCKSAYARLKYI